MKASDLPTRFPIPFAADAAAEFIRTIPETSADPVAASLELGFPPDCFTPVGAGGTPPDGRDTNGILNQTTAWSRWQGAGGPVPYNSAFATAIGGYPAGAILASTTVGLYWVSTADDNTTNPDAGGAGWRLLNRIRLAADINFYVATTGSDANSGLDAAHPWATLQHAWDVLSQSYDLSGHAATVNIADGTYASGLVASGIVPGQVSADQIVFSGNAITPSNVLISVTSQDAIKVSNGAAATIQNLKVETSGSGNGLNGIGRSSVSFSNIVFGACAGSHIQMDNLSVVGAVGNYSIAGNAVSHVSCGSPGIIGINGVTVTLIGTPAFTAAFANATFGSEISATGTTFVGSATGKRYDASVNGTINTASGGSNFFPGNAAGTTSAGGQYV